MHSPDVSKRDKWQGRNVLGNVLTEIRDELLSKLQVCSNYIASVHIYFWPIHQRRLFCLKKCLCCCCCLLLLFVVVVVVVPCMMFTSSPLSLIDLREHCVKELFWTNFMHSPLMYMYVCICIALNFYFVWIFFLLFYFLWLLWHNDGNDGWIIYTFVGLHG